MSLTNVTFIQQIVTLPYWQPESALTWFMTWIQPWIALIGIVDNALVVLIIGMVPGKQLIVATLTCRLYYVVISAAEFLMIVVGTLVRQSIPIASLLVRILILRLTKVQKIKYNYQIL